MPAGDEEQEEGCQGGKGKEDGLEEEEGGDGVGDGREAAEDERQGADPEDGREAEDGDVSGHRRHLLLKGLLVHLEFRLGVEVPLRPGLANDDEGGGHWQKVPSTPGHPGEENEEQLVRRLEVPLAARRHHRELLDARCVNEERQNFDAKQGGGDCESGIVEGGGQVDDGQEQGSKEEADDGDVDEEHRDLYP